MKVKSHTHQSAGTQNENFLTLQKLTLADLQGPFGLVALAVLVWSVLLPLLAYKFGKRIGQRRERRYWAPRHDELASRVKSLTRDNYLARELLESKLDDEDGSLVQISTQTGVEVVHDSDGYRIRIEKIREHRYVAQQCLGRKLERSEVVHHINARKADNRPENLCVLDKEKHEHFHAWLAWVNEKEGHYPSMKAQQEALVKEYGGILLVSTEGQSSSIIKHRAIPEKVESH